MAVMDFSRPRRYSSRLDVDLLKQENAVRVCALHRSTEKYAAQPFTTALARECISGQRFVCPSQLPLARCISPPPPHRALR